MSFHFPHLPARRTRRRVITPSGDPVPPLDHEYFRQLRFGPIFGGAAADPHAETLHADPAHVPTGPERRAVALAMRVPSRPAGPPRTKNGIRIVSSFFSDPSFAEPLREFVRTVHRPAAEMARRFDENAARIEYAHDLDTHFAAARRDGGALAAQYHEGGTETMTDLVAQVRARIVADALNGGAR